jgi:hypothetical protein
LLVLMPNSFFDGIFNQVDQNKSVAMSHMDFMWKKGQLINCQSKCMEVETSEVLKGLWQVLVILLKHFYVCGMKHKVMLIKSTLVLFSYWFQKEPSILVLTLFLILMEPLVWSWDQLFEF